MRCKLRRAAQAAALLCGARPYRPCDGARRVGARHPPFGEAEPGPTVGAERPPYIPSSPGLTGGSKNGARRVPPDATAATYSHTRCFWTILFNQPFNPLRTRAKAPALPLRAAASRGHATSRARSRTSSTTSPMIRFTSKSFGV